jgi:hypothetical protein
MRLRLWILWSRLLAGSSPPLLHCLTLLLEICPKGDDPATDNQNYRIIVLTVTGTLSFEGSLGLTFEGEKTFIDLPAADAEAVQTLLGANQKFGVVSVTYSSSDTTVSTHTFTLTFVSWPTLPKENNLYTHTADPALSEFTCDTSLMDVSVTCEFVDVQSSYLRGRLLSLSLSPFLFGAQRLPEYEYCSNKGVCDFTTGSCVCEEGYGGLGCDRILFPSSNEGYQVCRTCLSPPES